MALEPFIEIHDQDIRCSHVFPNDGRCWIIAAKVIKLQGKEVGRYCQFHLEEGLTALNRELSRAAEGKENGGDTTKGT